MAFSLLLNFSDIYKSSLLTESIGLDIVYLCGRPAYRIPRAGHTSVDDFLRHWYQFSVLDPDDLPVCHCWHNRGLERRH